MKFVSRFWIFALGLPLAVTSCDRADQRASQDPEWIRLEGRRIELEQKISVARIKMARLDRLRDSDDTIVNETLSGLRARSKDLAVHLQRLKFGVADLESELAKSRKQAIELARTSAVGLQFPTLDTRTGNHYDDVRVLAVNDSGVKISHASGISHLRCDDLDPELADRVGLDKDLERAANERLNRQQLAFEQQVARELEVAAAAQPAKPAASTAALASIYRTPVQVEQPALSRLSQPAYPVSGTSIYGYRSSYYRSSYYRPRYYYVWNTGSCYRPSYQSYSCYPRISPTPAPRTFAPNSSTTP